MGNGMTPEQVDKQIQEALAKRLEKKGKTLSVLDKDKGKLGKLGGFIEVPKPKGSSKDSSRLTINVPCGSEKATLNLGAPSNKPLVDMGLTGQTRSHIHWTVTDKDPTTVSLGGGMTSPGQDGSNGAARGGFSGYAMVTQGKAYHESKGQYYIYSPSDVIARAGDGAEVLLQSDSGKGTFFTGAGTTIATGGGLSIVAAPGLTKETPTYGGNVTGAVKGGTDRSISQGFVTAFDQIQSYVGIVRGIASLVKARISGGKGKVITMANARAVGPLLANIAKAGLFAATQGKNANDISIASADNVGMEGKGATVWGTLGATLASLVAADVVGGTAGVKAATYCGIWGGGGVSIEGGLEVGLSSPGGPISGDARGDVSFVSKTKDAGMAAPKGTAQITGKKAYVYGDDEVKVGTTGWSMRASSNSLVMGATPTAHELKKDPAKKTAVVLTKGLAQLRADDDSYLGVTKDLIELKTKHINFEADNVYLKGKKITLG